MNVTPEHTESPYVPTEHTSSETTPVSSGRFSLQTILVVMLYLISIFSWGSNVFYFENSSIYFASSVLFAIVGTVWAINDAGSRQQTFYPILRMLHLVLCPFSLMIYLIYTRGMKGVAIVVVHAIAMSACSYGAFFVAYYAVYYTGYWSLYDPVFLNP